MASLGDNMTAAGDARHLRRLSAAGQAGVCGRRAAVARVADAGELDQSRPAAAAGVLLLRPRAPVAGRPEWRSGGVRAERKLRQSDRRPDRQATRPAGTDVRRCDQRRTTPCRNTSARASTIRRRRCVLWRMRWMWARRATSSACRRCTVATSTPFAATSSASAYTMSRWWPRSARVYRRARVPAGSAQRDRLAGAAGCAGHASPRRRVSSSRRPIRPSSARSSSRRSGDRFRCRVRCRRRSAGPRHSVSMDV